MTIIDNLEAMLAKGQDSAVLRFSLGSAYLKQGKDDEAIVHLEKAVTLDPNYSAAWKLLGRALGQAGRVNEAIGTYQSGIDIAEAKGDIQAAKEMKVFVRRLESEAK
jgi:Tfp pilus assembly protein PilF